MTVFPDQAWSAPVPKTSPSPVTAQQIALIDAMKDGTWDVSDVPGKMINRFKKQQQRK